MTKITNYIFTPEVLSCLWDNISKQLEGNSTSILATNGNIEKHLRICHDGTDGG